MTRQMLELSPFSYLPALSTYYGIVLSLTSSPHSSSLQLQLHPSCRPVFNDTAYQGNQEYDEDDVQTNMQTSKPKYFGEDLEYGIHGNGEGEDGETNSKTIALDDIVDCRRIVLV